MLLSALRAFQLRLPTRFINTRHSPYRSLSTMGTIDTQTVDTTDRLAALRKHMAEHNVSAYIVPSEDQRKSLGPSDWRPAQIQISFQISASTQQSAIIVGHSFLVSMALLVC
jgi:hypothetical protein